jgi:hypothetical protein
MESIKEIAVPTKEDIRTLLDKFQPDPLKQGFQVTISPFDFESLRAYKAGLFRDGAPLRYVGPNKSAQKGHAPGVWTFETEDGFARANVVFDWRDRHADTFQFMTVELAGEPIWIDREPFRADIHQFAALWAAIPDDVKETYRWYATSSRSSDAIEFIERLDNYRKPIDGSDLPVQATEREIVEGFLSNFDVNEEADISVEEWQALDDFKQSISFADPVGYVIETATPEEDGENWHYTMTSPDGFVRVTFVFDVLPTFYSSIRFDGEPWWDNFDVNECNAAQQREVYAMLPDEAKEHLRKIATGIDAEYYAEMIEYVTGSRPAVAPNP